ncbi:hypothetical protein ACSBR2_016321 [Camellia fascicularis]
MKNKICSQSALKLLQQHWNGQCQKSSRTKEFEDSDVDFVGTKFQYIPFGAGRRMMCPGISFGVVNVELLLAQLLYFFYWKLASRTKLEDINMTESFGATARRKRSLCLIGTPYSLDDDDQSC